MHASLHVVAMLFDGTFHIRRISETHASLHASLHVASLKALLEPYSRVINYYTMYVHQRGRVDRRIHKLDRRQVLLTTRWTCCPEFGVKFQGKCPFWRYPNFLLTQCWTG